MAVFAFTNGFVLVNAVNLSDHCKSVTLNIDVDQLDSTGFGSSGSKSLVGGLKSGTLSIEFMDDFAAGNVDATLWPLLGTVVAFDIRADAGARSVTNPSYTGNVLISQHAMGGKLGELLPLSVSYPTSGAVSRLIA